MINTLRSQAECLRAHLSDRRWRGGLAWGFTGRSSGRYAHEALQPEISDPQVTIIAPGDDMGVQRAANENGAVRW